MSEIASRNSLSPRTSKLILTIDATVATNEIEALRHRSWRRKFFRIITKQEIAHNPGSELSRNAQATVWCCNCCTQHTKIALGLSARRNLCVSFFHCFDVGQCQSMFGCQSVSLHIIFCAQARLFWTYFQVQTICMFADILHVACKHVQLPNNVGWRRCRDKHDALRYCWELICHNPNRCPLFNRVPERNYLSLLRVFRWWRRNIRINICIISEIYLTSSMNTYGDSCRIKCLFNSLIKN